MLVSLAAVVVVLLPPARGLAQSPQPFPLRLESAAFDAGDGVRVGFSLTFESVAGDQRWPVREVRFEGMKIGGLAVLVDPIVHGFDTLVPQTSRLDAPVTARFPLATKDVMELFDKFRAGQPLELTGRASFRVWDFSGDPSRAHPNIFIESMAVKIPISYEQLGGREEFDGFLQFRKRFSDQEVYAPILSKGFTFPLSITRVEPAGGRDGRSVWQLFSQTKPSAKNLTVKRIYFSNARIGDVPVEIEPYEPEFELTGTERKPLAAPLIALARSEDSQRLRDALAKSDVTLTAAGYFVVQPPWYEAALYFARTVVFPARAAEALPGGSRAGASRYRLIAEHFAPVVVQRTNDERRDFITKFNFDGNWNGSDNLEHLAQFPLHASVYYSVIESTTHYFVTYCFYHPQDYAKVTGPACGFFNRIGEHENDLEGGQMVIEKDGSEFGKLVVMETLAHNAFYQYENDSRVRDMHSDASVNDDIDGHVLFEAGDTSHPMVLVECLGHGVHAYGHNGKEVSKNDSYVVYRFGGTAGLPRDKNDHDVKYDLIDMTDPADGIWTHRREFEGDAKPYANPISEWWNGFGYEGHESIGGAFYGHQGNQAKPPWGWTAKGVNKGDWFIIPAYTFAKHLSIPGLKPEKSAYIYNPYLDSGGANPPPEIGITKSTAAETTPEKSNEPSVLWDAQTGFAGWQNAAGEWWNKLLGQVPEYLKLNFPRGAKDARGVIVRPDINRPAPEVSRVFFSYSNEAQAPAGRIYWRTPAMPDFDEEHSLSFRLSDQPGWHSQTVELLESEQFDPQSTIAALKIDFGGALGTFARGFSLDDLKAPLGELRLRLFGAERSDYLDRKARGEH